MDTPQIQGRRHLQEQRRDGSVHRHGDRGQKRPGLPARRSLELEISLRKEGLVACRGQHNRKVCDVTGRERQQKAFE
jgi:hypothetical protein